MAELFVTLVNSLFRNKGEEGEGREGEGTLFAINRINNVKDSLNCPSLDL